MNRTIIVSIALVATLAASGCVNRQAQSQAKRTEQILSDPTTPVVVLPVNQRTVTQRLEVTGEVTTSQDSQVGAKNPGKLVAVYVKDGDAVQAGQVLATMDTSNLVISAQQAQAQVSAALSALSQARANAAVGPSKTSAALAQAQAQLRSAKAQLAKARTGARSEEKDQAKAQMNSAKSAMETAKKDLDRQQQLFAQGAVPKSRLDQAENAYQAALSQYESALANFSMMQNMTRPEDLATAQESVRQAEEGVRSAQAQKKLDSLLYDQVRSAQANLQSAQAQASLARQALTDSQIRAPFSGRVYGKPAQPGSVLGAGTPLMRLIGSEGIYFEGELPESSVVLVNAGNAVDITVDAYGQRTFAGKVIAVSPSASSVGRLFKVRIQFVAGTADVKPGMFARGSIALRQVADALTVPNEAIVRANGEDFVFIVLNDKAKKVKVTRGLSDGDFVQVSGVAHGDQVVVSGQAGLSDGGKVRIESAGAASKKGG